MSPARALLRLAAALGLALAAVAAAAEARVQVSTQATLIRVSAEIETTVSRAIAWEVLTDYGRWAEFIPDLRISRVVSRPGEPLLVEQRGSLPQLPNFPLVVLTEVEEVPPRLIRFQRIAGNIRALAGEWLIRGEAPVLLLYRSTVEPGFPMPPQMTAEFFRQDAKQRLEAMAREMARRSAAAR